MPSRSELWRELKTLGLDKTQGLKYSMSKAEMENALDKHNIHLTAKENNIPREYIHKGRAKNSRYIETRGPFKNPKKAKKPTEEPVEEKPEEPEEVDVEFETSEPAIDMDFDDVSPPSKVDLTDVPVTDVKVPEPDPVEEPDTNLKLYGADQIYGDEHPMDPELEQAINVFSSVAETNPPTNNMTWQPWWVKVRKQIKNPDNDKIQSAMREWIKDNYDFTL